MGDTHVALLIHATLFIRYFWYRTGLEILSNVNINNQNRLKVKWTSRKAIKRVLGDEGFCCVENFLSKSTHDRSHVSREGWRSCMLHLLKLIANSFNQT